MFQVNESKLKLGFHHAIILLLLVSINYTNLQFFNSLIVYFWLIENLIENTFQLITSLYISRHIGFSDRHKDNHDNY